MQIHSNESLARVHGLQTPGGKNRSLLTRFLEWRKARAENRARINKALQQYDELLRMPNYMLADVGLTRDIVRQERKRLLYTGILPAPHTDTRQQ